MELKELFEKENALFLKRKQLEDEIELVNEEAANLYKAAKEGGLLWDSTEKKWFKAE